MKRPSVRPAIGFFADLLQEFSRCNLTRSAAALTYYFVLSVFPLLICVNACVGMLHVDATALLDSLARFLPADALHLAKDYVNYLSQNNSPLLLPAGITAMLLSGSAGVRILLGSIDEFLGQKRQAGLRRIAVSILFSFLLLVGVYLALVVVLAGDWLFGAVGDLLPPDMGAGWALSSSLWLDLRYLLLFAFVLLMVLILYRLGMARRGVSGTAVLVCSLIGALALGVASVAFSWFIGLSANYSLLYGSLASVIILLLWLFLCSMILLLGALLAAVWSRRHPSTPREEIV